VGDIRRQDLENHRVAEFLGDGDGRLLLLCDPGLIDGDSVGSQNFF
jgi:hypothetical protein